MSWYLCAYLSNYPGHLKQRCVSVTTQKWSTRPIRWSDTFSNILLNDVYTLLTKLLWWFIVSPIVQNLCHRNNNKSIIWQRRGSSQIVLLNNWSCYPPKVDGGKRSCPCEQRVHHSIKLISVYMFKKTSWPLFTCAIKLLEIWQSSRFDFKLASDVGVKSSATSFSVVNYKNSPGSWLATFHHTSQIC